MASNKTNGIANQFIGQCQSTCPWIGGTCLHHNPLADKRLHVMPPDDVRFQYLARTRVKSGRSHSICFLGCGIGQYRVTHIISLYIKRIVRHNDTDSILETCTLKSFVPIKDTLRDIRSQMFWHCPTNIEGDRLDRFHQLSTHVGKSIGGLKSPTSNVIDMLYVLLAVTIDDSWRREVTHPPIFTARTHRLIRQQHDGCADHNG